MNEWLRREGYLLLREEPQGPRRLTPELVDWSRTAAWGEGGHDCRLCLNIAGREPAGTVAPSQYERVRGELAEKLATLGATAHRPEDLYTECRGVPPDLVVYFDDLYRRSVGQVGTGSVHTLENDTGPDDANHAHEGLYVLSADGVSSGPGPERDIRDIAPTLLEVLGVPVPPEMERAAFV